MEILSAGKDAIAIYINSSELENIVPEPRQMTTADAAGILHRALGSTDGLEWYHARIELYPGQDSLLLFAWLPDGAPSFFSFSSIEPVISAAKACPRGISSLLTYLDNRYVLTVYPTIAKTPPSPLYEYGTPLDRPDCFALHLTEHGKLISAPTALDFFRNSF